MKMRYLRDREGKIDRRYTIAEDGSYIRDKKTKKKLNEKSGNICIHQEYRKISIPINNKHSGKIKICHLQWLAWRGIIPKKHVIHHKKWNNDKKINAKLKLNDDIKNLSCMTKQKHYNLHNSGKNNPNYRKSPSEETREKQRKASSGEKNPMFGANRSGENGGCVKLKNKYIRKIRYLKYIKNWTMPKIADKFGVSASCINHIIQGHTWNPDNLTKQELIQQTILK